MILSSELATSKWFYIMLKRSWNYIKQKYQDTWSSPWYCGDAKILSPKTSKTHSKLALIFRLGKRSSNIPVGLFIKYRLIVIHIFNNNEHRYNGREWLGRSKVLGLYCDHKPSVFFFIDVIFQRHYSWILIYAKHVCVYFVKKNSVQHSPVRPLRKDIRVVLINKTVSVNCWYWFKISNFFLVENY